MKELNESEMRAIDGGMTRNQEIWLERGVAFLFFGLIGVAVYEIGRMNG